MPARRDRTQRARLDVDQHAHLLDGELLDGSSLEETFGTDEARRRAWERHRPELLAEYRPGTRPYAWWLYEAPPEHRPSRPFIDSAEEQAARLARIAEETTIANPEPRHPL